VYLSRVSRKKQSNSLNGGSDRGVQRLHWKHNEARLSGCAIEGASVMALNFRHSGQLGDIVYAIPAMRAIARRHGASRFALYVPSDNAAHHADGLNHIGGTQMVSQPMFDFIVPLLRRQPFIEAVHFVPSHEIPADPFDCDRVRDSGINMCAGNIKDYYYKLFAVLAESPEQWVAPSETVSEKGARHDILIGRSTRYLNQAIDYGVLTQLGLRIGFVGLAREFDEFHARFPDLPIEYVRTRDALEVCDRIAEASLYIGNQSFFFAIAEALQTNRLLEAFEPVPNVVPSGGRCGQFVSTFGMGALVGTFFSRDVEFPNGDASLASDYLLSL
jgi:hypothetical protein